MAILAGLSLGMGGSAILTIGAFSLAYFGISGSLPVFWNLPTAFLGAAAAAGGIAFIISIGNIAGYAAPQTVGVLHDISRLVRDADDELGRLRGRNDKRSGKRWLGNANHFFVTYAKDLPIPSLIAKLCNHRVR